MRRSEPQQLSIARLTAAAARRALRGWRPSWSAALLVCLALGAAEPALCIAHCLLHPASIAHAHQHGAPAAHADAQALGLPGAGACLTAPGAPPHLPIAQPFHEMAILIALALGAAPRPAPRARPAPPRLRTRHLRPPLRPPRPAPASA